MPDPIIVRTVERTVGLRGAGDGDASEALGIYTNRSGEDVFVVEREGMRFLPDQRLVAYRDIELIKFDLRVKVSAEARKLTLFLSDGEQLMLPVDGQRGEFLDIFPIHAFLTRRAYQHRKAKLAVSE